MEKMRSTIAGVMLLAAASTIAAQEWSQWRGPDRTGLASAFKAPAAWPDRPTRVWTTEAGVGHASPIVAEGRVFLFSRAGDQEVVAAFDVATGKPAWRQSYDAPYQVNPAAASHGKGPKSTPLYAGGRVFTFGIAGILSAWEAKSGRLEWRRDFRADYKATSPVFGVAMSPIAVDDRLVVHAGGDGSGAILALNQVTGATEWVWKEDGPAYASPVRASFGSVTQLVTQSQHFVIGLSAADGRPLWRIPFTTDYDQNIVTPVITGDVVVYGGLSKPTTAVRIRQQAGKWTHEPVWENADIPMYMSSPVLVEGHLYGLTHRNRGQFFCVDAATGRTTWTTRGREAENAALVAAGGLLVAATTEGELVIVRANPTAFELVKRYTVAESPIWAHPALTATGIVIKDEATLAHWRF